MLRLRRMRAFFRVTAAVAAAFSISACATAPPAPTCPDGQQRLRTAQLFFGRQMADSSRISEAAFRNFVDDELTPRFPDGLTILDGGGQWRGPENKLIREASKVVLIVLPKRGDAGEQIEAVRTAYKSRFHQDSVLLITQAACVSF